MSEKPLDYHAPTQADRGVPFVVWLTLGVTVIGTIVAAVIIIGRIPMMPPRGPPAVAPANSSAAPGGGSR